MNSLPLSPVIDMLYYLTSVSPKLSSLGLYIKTNEESSGPVFQSHIAQDPARTLINTGAALSLIKLMFLQSLLGRAFHWIILPTHLIEKGLLELARES